MRFGSIRLRAAMKTHSRNVLSILIAGCLALGVLFIMAGCGGSGYHPGSNSSPTPSPSSTPTPIEKAVSVSVTWGPRTRAVVNGGTLTSAESAILYFYQGGVLKATPDATLRINRDLTKTGSYTANYTTSDTLDTTQLCLVDVVFYANPNQLGAGVGSGYVVSTISTSTGALQSNINIIGVITSVSVASPSVFAGETADLAVSGTNTRGDLIPVTPGSITVDITGGASNLALVPDNTPTDPITVKGLLPGTATITASIDGVTSAPTTVTIGSRLAVSITPSAPMISLEQQVQLSATVTGLPTGVGASGQQVTWSVLTANGGSITSSGLYTAPKAEGTFQVQATSVYDPTKQATINIIVVSGVTVQIVPSAATLRWEQSIALKANVALTTDQSVTWAVEGTSSGTITTAGVYTAPKLDGTYFVDATSNYDPRKSARIAITVLNTTAITVTPAVSQLSWLDTVQLTAKVTNQPGNLGVTWSVSGGSANGTITSSGLYTAPKVNGTYTVIATSIYDPRKKGTATINVNSQVKVAVSPNSNVKVNVNDTLQFNATVTRAIGDNSVTWQVLDDPAGPPVGTISATGLYSAPAKRRVDTIRAISNFDPNQFTDVKVQVTAGGVGVIIN